MIRPRDKATGVQLSGAAWHAAGLFSVPAQGLLETPEVETGANRPILTLSKRSLIQNALQTIAASLGEDAQSYTPHSMRFGGASAMWAGGFDSYVLRSWGRWNSDAFWPTCGLPGRLLLPRRRAWPRLT